MKSYIVPGLDSADKDLLHNNGIVFFPWNTEIIVDESQLAEALRLLGATATEAATEYENMYMLTLTFTLAPTTRAGEQRAADRARRQSRINYIEACKVRLQAFVDQAQTKVTDGRNKLGPAQNSFATLSRQMFVAAQNVDDEGLKSEFTEQFERLLAVPHVKAVRVTTGSILVYTDTIGATDPRTGSKHELGEFLIVIRTDGADDGVHWFNSTRRVRTIHTGMNAPRVYADGTCCVDEVKETLLELIAQFEFATVAELAIQFVETLSNDELSKHIDRWPLAQEKCK